MYDMNDTTWKMAFRMIVYEGERTLDFTKAKNGRSSVLAALVIDQSSFSYDFIQLFDCFVCIRVVYEILSDE